MSGGQPIHICFFSKKCKWSVAFLEELAKTPFLKEFKLVCVDPAPNRAPLPSWLKKVPTLVISGEPEPRTDGNVMNWLYEKKMKDSTAQHTQNSAPDGSPGGEPSAWSMAENISFGKGFGYSFNDADTLTNGDGGASIPGAFSFLNGGAAPGDKTSQGFPGAREIKKDKTKKEEMFDKQMEAYQKSREEGMPNSRPRT